MSPAEPAVQGRSATRLVEIGVPVVSAPADLPPTIAGNLKLEVEAGVGFDAVYLLSLILVHR